MSDDERDDISEPVTEPKPGAGTQVNDTADDTSAPPDAESAQPSQKLSGLMADGARAAQKQPAVDLESQAIRAAEQALAEGEQALQQARAQIAREQEQSARRSTGGRRRELALRLLLAGNVLAMVIVALLPVPSEPAAPAEPAAVETPTSQIPEPVVQAPTPRLDGAFERALLAASRHEWVAAIDILERYLEEGRGMTPSTRLSVLLSLAHYSSRAKDFEKSEMYSSRAQSLEQSHSLPEDLVRSAEAALARGDQESLRRLWARFLLQQRQIPSWLYQHVAQAYLQLGDSYRKDADAAAEKVRIAELEAAASRLRAETEANGGKR